MNDWYQMDLFDLQDKEYTPKRIGMEHYQSGVVYYCPKCNAPVGSFVDGKWLGKRSECKNGHKIKWKE